MASNVNKEFPPKDVPDFSQFIVNLFSRRAPSDGHSPHLVLQSQLLPASVRSVHERMPSAVVSLFALVQLLPSLPSLASIEHPLPFLHATNGSHLSPDQSAGAVRDHRLDMPVFISSSPLVINLLHEQQLHSRLRHPLFRLLVSRPVSVRATLLPSTSSRSHAAEQGAVGKGNRCETRPLASSPENAFSLSPLD